MLTYYGVNKQWRKLMSLLGRRGFNSSKCKTWARMTVARIKLLRNKREASVRQMKRDLALLLQSRQDATARIRVEHVIREQNMMAANEILELFCERLVTRLSVISSQRNCPDDLKEVISSLIFAAPRCSDIPELVSIRDIFVKKYGKDFVSAATDLCPDSGVNRLLVEKLSALNPTGELKLKVMKEIAKEYQVEWDTAETEAELFKPPDERLEGPRTFVSVASLPLNAGSDLLRPEAQKTTTGLSVEANGIDVTFQNVASAAKAAAISAKNAVAAADAAARLAENVNATSNVPQHSQAYKNVADYYSHNGGSNDMDSNTMYAASNARRVHSDILFDDSDYDEETDTEHSASDTHSTVPLDYDEATTKPGISPKVPDYDAIAARFEELRYKKNIKQL